VAKVVYVEKVDTYSPSLKNLIAFVLQRPGAGRAIRH